MSIFGWLRRHDDPGTERKDTEQVSEAVERVIALNPRLAMAPSIAGRRLTPAMAASLRYAGDLVASLPAPHEASAQGVGLGPLPARLLRHAGRTAHAHKPLRRNMCVLPTEPRRGARVCGAWNGHDPASCVLGVELEGGTEVRHDVAQTTVCFGDHRVRVCGPHGTGSQAGHLMAGNRSIGARWSRQTGKRSSRYA